MTHRRKSGAIRVIKQRVEAWAFGMTYHAVLEMIDEDITKEDIREAVVQGHLVARYTRGGRGTRYALRGPGMDGRQVEAVCRILREKIRIVTVYRVG